MTTEQKLKAIREKCVERIQITDFESDESIAGWKTTIAACDLSIGMEEGGLKDNDMSLAIIEVWEGLV